MRNYTAICLATNVVIISKVYVLQGIWPRHKDRLRRYQV